ncbi:DUF7331 family protein [Halopiger goleimassiliensis]|uniref:DUF7331 family protein n=1 Tax=Halopiger goleimassiliensis TaxID=1293048 RepID=UPI000A436A3A|nr:hypothetical protein [Halopiger goleimassiliensis]
MNQHSTPAEREPSPTTFDEYVRYEDDDATVICDRTNPAAWIRSSVLEPCRR